MQEKDKGIKFPVQGANETGHFQKKAVGVVFVFFFFKINKLIHKKLGIGNFQGLLYTCLCYIIIYIQSCLMNAAIVTQQ